MPGGMADIESRYPIEESMPSQLPSSTKLEPRYFTGITCNGLIGSSSFYVVSLKSNCLSSEINGRDEKSCMPLADNTCFQQFYTICFKKNTKPLQQMVIHVYMFSGL